MRSGWREVLPSDPDQGVGFYRFAAKDVPGLPSRSHMANVIEVFAENLDKAQVMLGIVVAQARQRSGQKNAQAAPIKIQPVAHRPTRMCKRARRERGE